MRNSLIVVALLLLIASGSEAQTARDSLRGKYIKKYPDKFFIWPVLKYRTLAFDVDGENAKGDALNFKPNKSTSLGVGAYLFDIAAEVSFSIPLDEKSTSRHGTSLSRDLSTGLLGSNWGVDVFVQRYESFYLANPTKNPKANEPYPLRPDIVLTNFGGNGIYIFNKNKFSLWSSYNFSERQLKSKGSVYLAWTVNNVHLTADSVILSKEYLTRLNTNTNFSDLRYATFSVAPGYSYNLVWRKLFLNASVAIGPAHHWVYYVGADNVPHYDIAINTFVDTRIAAGYSSDRWFGGITITNQAREVKFEEIVLDTNTQSVRIVVGYRVDEKGFLKKSWKEIFPKSVRKYL